MGKNEKACGCGTNGLAKNGKFQKPLPTKSVEMKVGKGTMTRVGNQVIVGADAFPELREQLAASRNVRNAAPPPSELRSGVAGNILNLRKLPLPAEAANQILVNNRVGVFRFNTPPDGEGLAVNNLLIRPSTSLTVQSRLSRIQFLTDLNVPIAGAMNERANRSVFMGAMRVGASFGSRTLSEVGLVQVAEGKDTPKIGPKPEKPPNGVLVPSDPQREAEDVVIKENGKADTHPVAGEQKRELLKCGNELLVTQHFDIHCEVIILRTTVSSDKDANTYKCDSDAQTISDQSLPDVIVSLPTLSQIVDDIMAGKEVSDQQAAEARAYFGICKCVTDEVIKARGTRKDENGKDIPKPPLVADADIVCEPPCVKVWTHWCYQGAYMEIKRWCEVEKTTDKSTLFRTEYEHQIVIKVLLEGWFELGWRVRCVTAAESKEAQELVNGGLLTPEGNPVGHYRPDWLPPVTQNPLPDNCCLVITDMAISSIRPCRIGEFNYGHVFDVIIDYEWVTGSGPAPILEWHEYSDNFPAWQEPLGVSDNAWNDQFDKINKSPVFDDWKRAFPKVCRPGDSGQIKLHDVPTLGWKAPPPQVTEDRQLWIKVRTVDCNKVERAVCLYQSLSTKADGSHSGKAVEYACDKSKPASGDAPPSPDDMVVVKEANYDDQLRGVESCK